MSARHMSARRWGRRRVSRPVWATAAFVMAIALLLAGCTSDAPIASNVVPPPATIGQRVSFVTLGGNETVARGLDESVNQPWNQQVFASLPLSATFANVASRDATVGDAITEQVPKAIAEQPTIAVVWFGAGDFNAKTSVDTFATQLTAVVTPLQSSGAKVLLIARTQPDQRNALDRYNAAIASVAAATGATLVKIEGQDALRSPTEHIAIARAIEAVL